MKQLKLEWLAAALALVAMSVLAGCNEDRICPNDGQGYYADTDCDEAVIGDAPTGGAGGSNDGGAGTAGDGGAGASGTGGSGTGADGGAGTGGNAGAGGNGGSGGSPNCCGPNCEICAPGEQCFGNDHCVPVCPDDPNCPTCVTWCDGNVQDCVDLSSDPNNCHGCGQAAPPNDATCDAFDDDCDGLVDEDAPNCNCVPNGPEVCDLTDNDCNGLVDENLGNVQCGLGVCQHFQPLCVNGQAQVCNPLLGASSEACSNGQDDDCDGFADCNDPDCSGSCVEVCDGNDNDGDTLVDEDLGFTPCGLGACAHIQANCVGGVAVACNPLQGAVAEICNDAIDNDCDGLTDCNDPSCSGSCNEVCDGQDNNNNGLVDELLGETQCGLGVCMHFQTNCVGGVTQVCNPMLGSGAENCSNGLDDDCDGYPDCVDPDCSLNPACVETCNGLDDDGDGKVDEGLGQTQCGLGVCQHFQDNCVNGAPAACNPFQGAGAENCSDGLDNDCDGYTDCNDPTCSADPSCVEICNGQDDNNNALVDEGLGQTACGLGACFHFQWNCVNGNPVACDPLQGMASESCSDGVDNDCDGLVDCVDPACAANPACNEVCNGLDDDNNGQVDEGLGVTQCGLGVCQHFQQNCVGGAPAACNPFQGAGAENCSDGVDNDCDGYTDCVDPSCSADPSCVEVCNGQDDNNNALIDENLGTTSCGLGVCFHFQDNCVGGVTQVCNPLQGASSENCSNGLDDDCDGYPDCSDPECSGSCVEVCNGVDDNNNGFVDEGFGVTQCGLGVCQHIQQNCVNGNPVACNPFQGASAENCSNGLDDDCDGLLDCSDPSCSGNPACVEVCNGLDDNNNALIDEGLGSTTCGLGICNHVQQNCVGGVSQVCNPFLGAQTENCSNGLDDDCDGLLDCGDPSCSADPACNGGGNGQYWVPYDGSIKTRMYNSAFVPVMGSSIDNGACAPDTTATGKPGSNGYIIIWDDDSVIQVTYDTAGPSTVRAICYPTPSTCNNAPFLVDLQNTYIANLGSFVAVPFTDNGVGLVTIDFSGSPCGSGEYLVELRIP